MPVEMSRGSTDFSPQLTRINEAKAKYVLFQNTSSPVALAIKNSRDLGLDLVFGCLNWCTNRVLTELAGEAAEGVMGSVIFSPPGKDVVGLEEAEAFLGTKGSSLAEQGMLYGQGWVTMSIMLEGVKRAAAGGGEVTGEGIKAALETLEDFSTGGVTMPVTYNGTDHRGVKGMRVFRVEDGRWRPITDLRTARG